MGIAKKNLVIIVLCLFFGACSVLENGYTNKYGQYIPKNPNFKLKNKQGNVIDGIDTLAIYRMVEMYDYRGVLIYPKSNFSSEERYSFIYSLNQVNIYVKFYNNGRCLKFSMLIKDAFGMQNKLKEEDLNPNNQYYSKSYYYSPDGKHIQIESFVYGAGNGHYVISNYIFNESKDTLTKQNKYFKMVYKKESIPLNWNKYKVDW